MRTAFSLAVLLSLVTLSPAPAEAGEPAGPGHFDRDRVVAASAAFRSVAGSSQAALGPLERDLMRTDGALAALDLSIQLTRGGGIERAHHELWDARLVERSNRFGSEFGAFQEQLDGLGVGFEDAFEQALQRAIAGLAAEGFEPVVECAAKSNDPFALTGPGGQRSAPTCEGTDLSERISAAWDADEELKAALGAIVGQDWQKVTTYEGSEPPLALAGLDPAGVWLAPSDLVDLLPEAIEVIDDIDRRTQRAREELLGARAGLEDGPELEAQVDAIRTRARETREWSEARKQAVGAVLWDAVERGRKKGKKDGWSSVGICMNPEAWGGCAGKDVTRELIDVLLGDRKLAKELAKLRDTLGAPDVSLP